MAERTSSRTAVRMAIGFMTSSNNDVSNHEDGRDPTPASSGNIPRHRGRPGRRVQGVYSASADEVEGVFVGAPVAEEITCTRPRSSTNMPSMIPRVQPRAQPMSTRWHDPIPSTAGSQGSVQQEKIQRPDRLIQSEELRADEHAVTTIKNNVHPANNTNQWVRFAWEPLAERARRDIVCDSSKAYPPIFMASDVAGIRNAATRRLQVPPRQEHEKFGVKRFRASGGHSNIDDQGGEAKRIGSPHRLIRRIPVNQGKPPGHLPLGGLSRQQFFPTPRGVGLPAGAMGTQRVVMPVPNDPLTWAWVRGSDIEGSNRGRARLRGSDGRYVTGGAYTSCDHGAAGTSTGLHISLPTRLMPPTNTAHQPTVSRREPGEARNLGDTENSARHSLKVQRLAVGHMDTLTDGVGNLGVCSTGAGGVFNGGKSLGAALRKEGAWRWKPPTESMGNALSSVLLHPPTPALALGVRRKDVANHSGSGEAWSAKDCHVSTTAASYGSEYSKMQRDGSLCRGGASSRDIVCGHHPDTTPGARISGGTTIMVQLQPPPLQSPPLSSINLNHVISHVELNSDHQEGSTRSEHPPPVSGTSSRKGGLGEMDVESVQRNNCSCATVLSPQVTETSILLYRLSQSGNEAPGYDAAVNSTNGRSNDESATVNDEGVGGISGAGGGEVDEDSSDGGAAHEEISTWLHSTQDWWTS